MVTDGGSRFRRVSQQPIYAIWYIRHLLSLWIYFIWYRPAQHPALANSIGSLIDQKFRIVFQWSVVNGIWIEGLGIPKVSSSNVHSVPSKSIHPDIP